MVSKNDVNRKKGHSYFLDRRQDCTKWHTFYYSLVNLSALKSPEAAFLKPNYQTFKSHLKS